MQKVGGGGETKTFIMVKVKPVREHFETILII